MMEGFRRRWQRGKVVPGDGTVLPDYRIWQLFARSLFFLTLPDASGRDHVYAVDIRHLAGAKPKGEQEDGKGRSPAALYRDGVQVSRSNVPATFPVPGGVIEVATTSFGLKRMHYVCDGDGEQPLRPHRRSQEGLRARLARRFPRTSTCIGVFSLLVLLTALTINLSQGIESLTRIDAIAARIGTFTSPIHLPMWANTGLPTLGILAGYERATRLRYHWLVDSAAS